jgi:hypothetical protein
MEIGKPCIETHRLSLSPTCPKCAAFFLIDATADSYLPHGVVLDWGLHTDRFLVEDRHTKNAPAN